MLTEGIRVALLISFSDMLKCGRMKLADLFATERGAQSRLAAAMGIHAPMLSQWASGARRVPAERCPEIERATGGQVRCEDLRPDIPWSVLREQTGHEPESTPKVN
jgi:DNA-binding transcriptional regulator YdaS (Cro superfamily)